MISVTQPMCARVQLAVSVGRYHPQVSGVVVEGVAVHVMHVLALSQG